MKDIVERDRVLTLKRKGKLGKGYIPSFEILFCFVQVLLRNDCKCCGGGVISSSFFRFGMCL